MTANPSQPSNSPAQPTDKVPEMEMWAFRKLMRDAFSIVSDPSEQNANLIRFISAPYNQFVENCRAISIYGHARGSRVCPKNIISVLNKFEISVSTFIEALENKPLSPPKPPAPADPRTVN
jgi:rRNA pseudouridine-1189 N-methylase Emg1 (Nep1/Mra1 family)